ncbi:MAG: hypothetical protein M0C28_14785 [Candidatus Moduliflexus flocculans]|nr:hypothetical protein [Candidatus Moduliflexus flocculans]
MTKKAFAGLFLCALAGALAFRLVRLDLRPMHADEANQAVKFGGLLERGNTASIPGTTTAPASIM